MAKKIGIVPSKGSQICQVAKAGAISAQLTYNGGPLLQNVDVITVYWGSAWVSDPAQNQIMSTLEQFFPFLVKSSYITQLQEYSVPGGPQIGFGTHSFCFQSNIDPGSTVDDSTIQGQLQAWIGAGTLPPSTANSFYFIFTPQGTTVTTNNLGGGASCTDFCGYHNEMGTDAFGGPFYAVVNYEDCAGCDFTGVLLNNFTEVISHELSEGITDPIVGQGWVDNSTGNEIGDICGGIPKVINTFTAAPALINYTSNGPTTDANGVITVVLTPATVTPPPPPPPPPPPVQDWTVQKLWSNNAQNCV